MVCSYGVKVGINLTDPVFSGVYHGKKVHESDLDDVLQRAMDVGCQKFMVTGSSLEESKNAVKLAVEKRLFLSCSQPAFTRSAERLASWSVLCYGRGAPLLYKGVRRLLRWPNGNAQRA